MYKIILLFLFIFSSCAHQEIRRSIASNELDTLRFETLNRFSDKRLQELKLNSSPLTKELINCYLGEISPSLETLRGFVTKYKRNPSYWNTISICYILSGDLNKAEYYLLNALSIKRIERKDKSDILNNLGFIYLSRGLYKEALDYFEEALKNSDLLVSKFNLAVLYLEFRKLDKAKKYIFELYKLNPKDPDFIFLMGQYKNEIR